MTSACDRCRFWNGAQQDGYSGMAQCRRNAPVVNKPHARGGVAADWPMTAGYDWCGEFRLPEHVITAAILADDPAA